MSGQSTVFLSNLFPLEISTDALNRCFGHRIKCVKRLSLLFLQVITTISGLILHNYLSLFCIKRALLLCEEKLFPKIPPSSCNALYEQFADFLRSSSCLLLWLFTHPVIANRFIRIKYEFWIKIIKPRFSWLPVVPTIFLTVWRQNIMCSGSFVLNYETIKNLLQYGQHLLDNFRMVHISSMLSFLSSAYLVTKLFTTLCILLFLEDTQFRIFSKNILRNFFLIYRLKYCIKILG